VVNVRGSVTRDDCKVKGIYTDEKPVAEIYVEVACFPDSHAEGNMSHTATAEEAGTGSARMDGLKGKQVCCVKGATAGAQSKRHALSIG